MDTGNEQSSLPAPKLEKDSGVIVLQVLRLPRTCIEMDYCMVSKLRTLVMFDMLRGGFYTVL